MDAPLVNVGIMTGKALSFVFFNVNTVDYNNPVIRCHQVQCSFEALVFLALPVEVHSDCHSFQVKR